MKKILPFILWMVTLSASAQTKFTGTYQLNQPKDCWHIAFKDLSTGLSTWAGRIGEKYAQATESGDEQGTIYQRFNFKTRRVPKLQSRAMNKVPSTSVSTSRRDVAISVSP